MPANSEEAWSKRQVQLLRHLVRHNMPVRYIADRLGKTRNAIIGKAHRLGLDISRREQPPVRAWIKGKPTWPTKLRPPSPPKRIAMPSTSQNRRFVPSVKHIPKKPQPAQPLPDDCWQPLPGSSPVALLNLTPGSCRWPLDHGLYCGLPTVGVSYCEVHAGIARRGWFAVKSDQPGIPKSAPG